MSKRGLAIYLSALLLALPAWAQAPLVTELEQSGLKPPTVLSEGYAMGDADMLVTQMLGSQVFASSEDNASAIGTITDLVVTPGLGLQAAVIDIADFPGVENKRVAVDFNQLEWAARPDGTRHWVLVTTPETLQTAPAFSMTATPPETEPAEVTSTPRAEFSEPASVAKDEIAPRDLQGMGVYGLDDQLIGTISDVLTFPDGSIDAVVVDVGGFLGLGAKPVAVGYDDPLFTTDVFGNRYLFLNTTRGELEAQPPYDANSYAGERERQRMVVLP